VNKKLKMLQLKYEYLQLELDIVKEDMITYTSDFDKYFSKYYQSPKEAWVNEDTGEVRFEDPTEHYKKAEEDRKARQKELEEQRELLRNAPKKVKNLYKKLAAKLHPDRGGTDESFQKLNNAYQSQNLASMLSYAGEYDIDYELDNNDEVILQKNLNQIEEEISRIKGTIGWLWGTGNKKDRLFCVKRVEEETKQKVSNEDLPDDLKPEEKEDPKLLDN